MGRKRRPALPFRSLSPCSVYLYHILYYPVPLLLDLYFHFSFQLSPQCNNSSMRTFPLPVWFPPTPCARTRALRVYLQIVLLCISKMATCSRKRKRRSR